MPAHPTTSWVAFSSKVFARAFEPDMTQDVPNEEFEQIQFVHWLTARGYKYSAIPHSTYTTSWKVKGRNHRMGVRPGVPDMIVIARKKLMFVELKRRKGGTTSPEQKEWIEYLTEAGIPARVCKGADEAIAFVEEVIA